MLQLTTKLMNKFSYSITTPFIPGNKDYHSCCNSHSVYQTYPKNRTLVWKSLTFGAETTRPLSLMVWRNARRCFQCCVRDSEKMSTSSMYTMIWLENGLKISFMMFWNSEGAFFRPKGITFHSYRQSNCYYSLYIVLSSRFFFFF